MSRSDQKKVLGIVVARMGSSRVPGKSMFPIGKQPMVAQILDNMMACEELDQLVLATTTLAVDDPLVALAEKKKVSVHRGHATNVLDRVYETAVKFDGDVIVEIGGDCPFISRHEIDPAIQHFKCSRFDYLCNYEPPTYPEGFDINIITIEALKRAYTMAIAPSQRVHPFSYLTFHKDDFMIGNIQYPYGDLSHHHWSLDYPEDLELIGLLSKKVEDFGGGISELTKQIEADLELQRLDSQLSTQKVEHAFWNASSIMNDIVQDVRYLVETASDQLKNCKYKEARLTYLEAGRLIDELVGFSNYREKLADETPHNCKRK